MSHFKAEMHQIRFRLGLRPRPALENCTGAVTGTNLWERERILRKTRGNDGNGNDFCGNTAGTGLNFTWNTANTNSVNSYS